MAKKILEIYFSIMLNLVDAQAIEKTKELDFCDHKTYFEMQWKRSMKKLHLLMSPHRSGYILQRMIK